MTGPPIPVAPFFPAGYGPVPGDFNGWVQSPLSALTGKVVFRAERAAALTLPTNTTSGSLVTLDSILEDPYGGWSASSGSWTAPWSGWYAVRWQATAASVPNAELRARVILATSVQWEGSTSWSNSSGLTVSPLEVPLAWIAGQDSVTFRVFCQVTSTPATFAVGTTTGQRCQAEIMWISS